MNRIRLESPVGMYLGVLILVVATLICSGCGDESSGPGNRAPVITDLEAAPEKTEPLESSTLTCSADDPDDDVLTYEWSAESGSLSGSGASVSWTAPDAFDTCMVTVIVSDDHGEADTAEASVEVPEGTLLVQTTEGLAAVAMDGSYFLYPGLRGPVEVLGTRVFIKTSLGSPEILEIDRDGATIETRAVPSGVWNYAVPAALPDTGIAFLDNDVDSIYVSDPQGNLIQSIAMPNGNAQINQVVDGVLAGSRLVISENGNEQVIEVDLETYGASILRDLADLSVYLCGIDYSRGVYYVCDAHNVVSHFTETGPTFTLSALDGTLIALTVVGNYAYVTAAGGDMIYKIDINSGSSEILVEGLSNPEDIEYVPMAMEPPAGR